MGKIEFGEEIKRLRKARGITQAELADQIGVDFTYISKIENNKTWSAPTRGVIEHLADVLNVSREHLLVVAGKINTWALQDLARKNTDAALLLIRLVDASSDQIRAMLVVVDEPTLAPPEGYIALSDAEIEAAEAEDRVYQSCSECGQLTEDCQCDD